MNASMNFAGSLVFAGLTGCASAQHLQRIERVELEGNPSVGTIVHIRQIHRAGVETATEAVEIERYQREIFGELRRQNVRHVLNEVGTLYPGAAEEYARHHAGVTLSRLRSAEDTAVLMERVWSVSPRELVSLDESQAVPHIERLAVDSSRGRGRS
jgi:hypothetical protein